MATNDAQKVTQTRPAPTTSAQTPVPVKQLSVNEPRKQAVVLHKKGKFKEAAQLYHVCLSANPNDAASWSNFGALLRTLKKSVGREKRSVSRRIFLTLCPMTQAFYLT